MSENDQATELTPKQALFVDAILTPGLTIAAAARLVKVADKTARRWLKLPLVKEAIRQAQRDLYEQSISGLLHLLDKSIKTLERNLEGDEVPPSTQVRSAQIVLERTTELFKLTELEQQIAELKQLLSTSDNS